MDKLLKLSIRTSYRHKDNIFGIIKPFFKSKLLKAKWKKQAEILLQSLSV